MQIERERGTGIGGEIIVAREGERGAIGIAGKVVGESAGGLSRSTEAAFEREKDVTALPAPVQAVQVWIERMLGRKLCRRGGIGGGVQTEMEAQSLVLACGNVWQRCVKTTSFSVQPGNVPWDF